MTPGVVQKLAEGADFVVTARDVKDYAETTGDLNPLHVDSAAARHHGLPGCIVPGAMITVFMEQVIWSAFGDPEIREIRTRFVAPVQIDQPISCSGRVARQVSGARGAEVTVRLLCRTPDRKIVCLGDAVVGVGEGQLEP